MCIRDRFQLIDWDEVKDLARMTELSESEKFYNEYIHRLRNRALNMKSILTEELSIKQTFIDFSGSGKVDSKEAEE